MSIREKTNIFLDRSYKKLSISYARYLKIKRSDRYLGSEEVSFAEKHSERVSILKKFILRMIILIVILIIVWPLARGNFVGNKLQFQNNNKQESKKDNTETNKLPVMMKPNFFGNDENGNPFKISAVSGVSVSETKIVLKDINAEMTLQDKSKLTITSSNGQYNNKEKKLLLNEGVIITTDTGYKFTTNSAYVNTTDNTATGSEPVKIEGRLGDINSNGFLIRNSGDEIVLFGDVNLTAQIDDKAIEGFNNSLKGK